MVFWGIEVKPGRPYTLSFDKDRGRLRISQATLGIGQYTNKSLVQCNVGNKSPVLLCALLPEKNESCHLDLEFEEVDDVVFSVIGPRSAHLTGYYVGNSQRHAPDEDSDTFGEDLGNADTDRSSNGSDDTYEDSFINDDDLEIFSPTPATDCEEEIMETNGTPLENGNGRLRRLKKKFQPKEDESDVLKCQQKISMRRRARQIVDSDDDGEDQRAVTSLSASERISDHGALAEGKMVEETEEKSGNKIGTDDMNAVKLKLCVDGERVVDTPVAPTLVCGLINRELKAEKRKKRKERLKEVPGIELDEAKINNLKEDSSSKRELQEIEDSDQDSQKDGHIGDTADEHHSEDHSEAVRVEKRKRRSHSENMDAETPITTKLDQKAPSSRIEGKNTDSKASNTVKLANGLVVEDLEVGESSEKVACSGKKVTVQYCIRSKDGGQIYRSTVETRPRKFRLGKGRVVKGLDIGIDGMQVGGRRRLIVPPALGFGSEDNDLGVPPNSWLIIDIDLIRVH